MTLYLRLDEPQSPTSDVKRLLPNVSNPANLPDEMLEAMGVARCVVSRPALEWWQAHAEPVTDIAARPVTITYPVVDRPLNEVKHLAKRRIEEQRDALIEPGLAHVFPDGTTGTVQLGQDHIRNLQTVAITALSAVLLDLDITISFRDGEDVQHPLTPIQGAVFALQASAYGSGIYATSWAAKDAIEAAQTVAGVVAVEWGG